MLKSRSKLAIIFLVILNFVLLGEIIRLISLSEKLRSTNLTNQQVQPSPTKTIKQTYIIGSYGEISRLPGNIDWPIYNNVTHNFSFQFYPEWHQSCDKPTEIVPYYPPGGGGYVGLRIELYENPKQLTLENFIKTNFEEGAIIFHEDRNDQFINLTVDGQPGMIDRLTPGAGDGQTLYINDTKNRLIIRLYCGNCDNKMVDLLAKSFRFSTFFENR